jgi:tetratricopeptide (TPR) repeat protein
MENPLQRKIQLLEQAEQAFREQRYTDAISLYEKGLNTFGDDPDLMWGLAQAEFTLSLEVPDAEDIHGHRAIHWLKEAIQIAPERPEYYFALGDMLEHVTIDYEAAAQAYRESLRLEPLYIPALTRLAMLYGVPEDVVPLEEALSCCEKAVRLFPTRSLWLELERLYRYVGRETDAQHATINRLLTLSGRE